MPDTHDWYDPSVPTTEDILRTLAARVDRLDQEVARLRAVITMMQPAAGIKVVDR